MREAATRSAQAGQLLADTGALAQRLGGLLRAFGATRASQKLTADEILVFLALGHLGLSATRTGLIVRPVLCADLSNLRSIPRETVRRKLARLNALGLVNATSRGALVLNEVEWRRIAALMQP
jgi:hypothetical protein